MAFLLKSSKLCSAFAGLVRHVNVSQVRSDLLSSQWKSLLATNEVLTKKCHATAVKKSPQNLKRIERAIYQLEQDAKYRHQILKKDLEEVMKDLEASDSIPYSLSLMLLKCCSKLALVETAKDRMELTLQLWHILEKKGANFDISHYNSLLRVYLENEFSFSPSSILKELDQRKIIPNTVTYTLLLKEYCSKGEITEATSLLEKMKTNDVPINLGIFNALIYGHCQVDDFESAYGILNLMKNKGIEPTSESYLLLACGYAKNGDIDKVKEILNKCEENEIVLMDKEYLEIIYVLATNGHANYVDEILEKVKKRFGYQLHAAGVIHRLLHKEMDDVAMKIFRSIPSSSLNSKTVSKYIINHAVKTKTAPQLIDFCLQVSEAESSSVPLVYALKETLLMGDQTKSLQLLTFMQSRNLPIRSHYFWPLIIQASKKGGNAEVLKILDDMRKMGVTRCKWTTFRVVFPNYIFKNNWRKDYDLLKNHGIRPGYLSSKFLSMLLDKDDVEDALELASTKHISGSPGNYISSLSQYLLRTNDAKNYVEILYYLLHDGHILSEHLPTLNSTAESCSDDMIDEGDLNNTSARLVEQVFRSLISKCSEELLVKVLQEILKKKIGLPPSVTDRVLEQFKSEEVRELVDKVKSPEFQLEYDPKILELKSEHGNENINRSLVGPISSKNLEETEKTLKVLGDKASIMDITRVIMFYVAERNDKEKIFELFEVLAKKVAGLYESKPIDKGENEYCRMVFGLIKTGNVELVQKACDIGVQYNVFDDNNYYPVLCAYIAREDFEGATNFFSDRVVKTGKVRGFAALGTALINSKNSELLKKLVSAVGLVEGENSALIKLTFQFAELGKVRQTRKLMETEGFILNSHEFREQCNRLFKKNSTFGLETLLAATRDTTYVDRSFLYKKLLALYMSKNERDKVKNLSTLAEEENIMLSSDFVKKLNIYLSSFSNRNFQEEAYDNKETNKPKENEVVEGKVKELLELGTTIEAYSLLMNHELKRRVARDVSRNLAKEGYLEELSKVWTTYSLNKYHRNIISDFLSVGKPENFIKFLQMRAELKDFSPIGSYFTILSFIPEIENNENLLTQLEEIACTAYADNNYEPLQVFFTLVLCSSKYQNKAIEIFDKYFKDAEPPLVLELIRASKNKKSSVLIKALLSHPEMKNRAASFLGDCYIFLVEHFALAEKLDVALSYLSEADKNNLAGLIPKEIIHSLSEMYMISNPQAVFPFSHLLEKDGEKGETALSGQS